MVGRRGVQGAAQPTLIGRAAAAAFPFASYSRTAPRPGASAAGPSPAGASTSHAILAVVCGIFLVLGAVPGGRPPSRSTPEAVR